MSIKNRRSKMREEHLLSTLKSSPIPRCQAKSSTKCQASSLICRLLLMLTLSLTLSSTVGDTSVQDIARLWPVASRSGHHSNHHHNHHPINDSSQAHDSLPSGELLVLKGANGDLWPPTNEPHASSSIEMANESTTLRAGDFFGVKAGDGDHSRDPAPRSDTNNLLSSLKGHATGRPLMFDHVKQHNQLDNSTVTQSHHLQQQVAELAPSFNKLKLDSMSLNLSLAKLLVANDNGDSGQGRQWKEAHEPLPIGRETIRQKAAAKRHLSDRLGDSAIVTSGLEADEGGTETNGRPAGQGPPPSGQESTEEELDEQDADEQWTPAEPQRIARPTGSLGRGGLPSDGWSQRGHEPATAREPEHLEPPASGRSSPANGSHALWPAGVRWTGSKETSGDSQQPDGAAKNGSRRLTDLSKAPTVPRDLERPARPADWTGQHQSLQSGFRGVSVSQLGSPVNKTTAPEGGSSRMGTTFAPQAPPAAPFHPLMPAAVALLARTHRHQLEQLAAGSRAGEPSDKVGEPSNKGGFARAPNQMHQVGGGPRGFADLQAAPSSQPATNSPPAADQMLMIGNHLGVAHLGPSSAPISSGYFGSPTVSFHSLLNLQDYPNERPTERQEQSQLATGDRLHASGATAANEGQLNLANGEGASSQVASTMSNMHNAPDTHDHRNQDQLGGYAHDAFHEESGHKGDYPSRADQGGFFGQKARSDSPAAGYPASTRTSTDSNYEDLSGGISSAEYERDLADMDEEFTRAAFRRPPPSSAGSPPSRGHQRDTTTNYNPSGAMQKEPQGLASHHKNSYPPRRWRPLNHMASLADYPADFSGSQLAADYINYSNSMAHGRQAYYNANPMGHYQPSQLYTAQYPRAAQLGWATSASSPYSSSLTEQATDPWNDSPSDHNPYFSSQGHVPAQYSAHLRWRPAASLTAFHHPRGYATAASGPYLSASASEQQLQPAQSTVGYGGHPFQGSMGYSPASSSVPTETVSIALSPLAAAAAAAASALASADKTRHHNNGWLTLPRLSPASTLTAAAGTPTITTAPSPSQTHAFTTLQTPAYPQYPRIGPTAYAPTHYATVPLLTLGRHVSTAALQAAASTGVVPSILPYFQSHQSGFAPAAYHHAYRPAAYLPASSLLTAASFAYPLQMPMQPVLARPPPPLALAAYNHRALASAWRPFYSTDLQLAETKGGLRSNFTSSGHQHHETSGGQSSSGGKQTGGLLKASSITAMAKNLTRKMFGSASQIKSQHVAPLQQQHSNLYTSIFSSPSFNSTLSHLL